MKVQKVSQSVSSFAGISFVHEEFNNCGLLQLIDQHPGQRNTSETGTNNCSGRGLRYSFAEEKWQKPYWNICDRHRKAYRAAAPDTLLRELKELATEDTIVTSSSGKEYRFNINEKMNDMNIKSLLLTGQLEKGRKDDLDYDNQIIEHEKWDAKRTCKHTTGYFAGIGPTGVYSHPKR
ncbi:MAG: IS1380 family transposase, partial [Paludibacteraceae bacterium]|nr:IS1380 family transposase [Paludibacteraceae bacterium]